MTVEAGQGSLDLEVIGSFVKAKTDRGSISCSRAAKGIDAETGDGDITLMVVGSSRAVVRQGLGRIDAGGIHGSLTSSTADGDVHIKAVPHDDWHLTSTSGNIRLELPSAAGFEVDAWTNLGQISINRDDLQKSEEHSNRIRQKVNGGGKKIELHTVAGAIVIG